MRGIYKHWHTMTYWVAALGAIDALSYWGLVAISHGELSPVDGVITTLNTVLLVVTVACTYKQPKWVWSQDHIFNADNRVTAAFFLGFMLFMLPIGLYGVLLVLNSSQEPAVAVGWFYQAGLAVMTLILVVRQCIGGATYQKNNIATNQGSVDALPSAAD